MTQDVQQEGVVIMGREGSYSASSQSKLQVPSPATTHAADHPGGIPAATFEAAEEDDVSRNLLGSRTLSSIIEESESEEEEDEVASERVPQQYVFESSREVNRHIIRCERWARMRNIWQGYSAKYFTEVNYATMANRLAKVGPPKSAGERVNERYTNFMRKFLDDFGAKCADFSFRS